MAEKVVNFFTPRWNMDMAGKSWVVGAIDIGAYGLE
jgi:hypothetical protein